MKVKKIFTTIAISTMLINTTAFSLSTYAATNSTSSIQALSSANSSLTKKAAKKAKKAAKNNKTSDALNLSAKILIYGTNWCPHCKDEKEVLTKMVEEYDGKIEFEFLDAEASVNKKAVKSYNITQVPFVVILNKKGEEVKTFTGFKDKSEIVKILKSNGLM